MEPEILRLLARLRMTNGTCLRMTNGRRLRMTRLLSLPGVDRDGVADADEGVLAARVLNRRRDADDVAVLVEERAAGVAGVDRRVGLDQLAQRPAGAAAQGAPLAADDAFRHASVEAEGVAH